MNMHNEKAVGDIPASLRLSRLLVQITFWGLLLAFGVKTVVLIVKGGSVPALLAVWCLQSLPLLIFAPGLHSRHLRTYAWLSFVSLLYFIAAVMTAFTPAALYYGVLLACLSMGLFGALVAYIHLARKYLGERLQS